MLKCGCQYELYKDRCAIALIKKNDRATIELIAEMLRASLQQKPLPYSLQLFGLVYPLPTQAIITITRTTNPTTWSGQQGALCQLSKAMDQQE